MATAITSTSFFGRSPEGFSHTEEGSRAHFRAKETEIKRYYTKTTRPNYRHNSEIGFEYSCASLQSFYSFKDRFSYNFQPMLLISGRLGHFLFLLFLSDEGPMLETLDHTIRIGSKPTFLYFDLYFIAGRLRHFLTNWRLIT